MPKGISVNGQNCTFSPMLSTATSKRTVLVITRAPSKYSIWYMCWLSTELRRFFVLASLCSFIALLRRFRLQLKYHSVTFWWNSICSFLIYTCSILYIVLRFQVSEWVSEWVVCLVSILVTAGTYADHQEAPSGRIVQRTGIWIGVELTTWRRFLSLF